MGTFPPRRPTPVPLRSSSLLLLFSLLLLSDGVAFPGIRRAGADKTSIVFTTLGRSRYAYDVFTSPVPTSAMGRTELELELQVTDGRSVNYNGFFPADPSLLLSLLSTAPPPVDASRPLEAVVYVSERNGSSNIYFDAYPYPQAASAVVSGAGRRRSVLQIPDRVQLPLLRPDGDGRVSMKDRPSVAGEHLVYVSTQEDPGAPRRSWSAVYSTHIPTGETRRLTPPGVADFSPAVSPSGEWTAVASSGERGWTGESQDLRTDLYVFRTRDGSARAKLVGHGGWPSWADDSTLYFHRQSEDGWLSVYRAVVVGIGDDLLAVAVVDRVTPPGFHAFTPAAGRGFVAMATRRPTSEFRHIEVLDLARNVFVEITPPNSPHSHHFNPFVSPDSTRIGYHRCRGAGVGPAPPMLESIASPLPEISLFRIDGSFPSFSPAGDQIAFVGLPGLYVVNSDGSGKREILSGNAFPTAWDRKRKGVIYTSVGPDFASESTEVNVVSITLPHGWEEEGGAEPTTSALPLVKKLTAGGENNAFPSPSPDGKWVVFRSGRSGHKNLYIMDAVEGESAGLRRLTDGPWTDTMCSWSPDGEWVAFSSDRDEPGGGGFALYLVRPDGTGLRRLLTTGAGGRANHAAFSPDSKRVVFTSDHAAVSAEPVSNPQSYQPYGEVFVVGVDGSGLRRLTHNSYEDGTPAWGPAYMKPADSGETSPPCDFEDCHWLNQMASSPPKSASTCPGK
uniref:Protein TolB n=1 Tax=Anthurium amnicola TaxID=1678845 RepID=A0A1D1YLT8_9ARAE